MDTKSSKRKRSASVGIYKQNLWFEVQWKAFKFDIGEGRSEVPDEKLIITRTNWAKNNNKNNNKNTIFAWKSGTAKIIITEYNWVCGIIMMDQVRVVVNRTVVDSVWRLDSLCTNHIHSQSELYKGHVSWWY